MQRGKAGHACAAPPPHLVTSLLLPLPSARRRLIFVGKTTLAYLRTVGSGKVAAAPAGGARRGVEPAPADSSGTPEEPARRRRTRRD